jgi:glutamine cyclotransferase
MTKKNFIILGGLVIAGGLLFCIITLNPDAYSFVKSSPVFGVRVVGEFPHDPRAFTQGLVFYQGVLYEGTGLYGESSVRQVELETGRIIKNRRLPAHFFGEGITLWKDQLIQLTWKNGLGLVYQRNSFKLLKSFSYPGEGWGITHNGKELIISDGSETLRFWDPSHYREVRRLKVHDRGSPVRHLNELEYIQGEIWANVFQTDRIVRISPESGEVRSWLDLKGLLSREGQNAEADVLNGIAYDVEKNRIFVTGKNWPKLFEIEVGREK